MSIIWNGIKVAQQIVSIWMFRLILLDHYLFALSFGAGIMIAIVVLDACGFEFIVWFEVYWLACARICTLVIMVDTLLNCSGSRSDLEFTVVCWFFWYIGGVRVWHLQVISNCGNAMPDRQLAHNILVSIWFPCGCAVVCVLTTKSVVSWIEFVRVVLGVCRAIVLFLLVIIMFRQAIILVDHLLHLWLLDQSSTFHWWVVCCRLVVRESIVSYFRKLCVMSSNWLH